ncbi:hypothetical protein Tsubulata_001688 [Turnera subulata]|uniref:Pentacotripeptide-repeat region of PRORP domain-containing protein n=1 Tax=Turnera subulata TaxID=218843 RepID=A0A9Q0J9W4_9ROSI|nr:hypothetical protein Tsubulata_001688 [Turnera subulata]
MSLATRSLLRKSLKNSIRAINSKYKAKQVHALVLKLKPDSIHPLDTLISSYSKFNLLNYCLLLFHSFPSPTPTVVAYKSIIKCYTSHALPAQSLSVFLQMRAAGMKTDHNVFPSVIKSCALLCDLRLGESVHGCVIRLGLEFDLYTGNALMSMYAKHQGLDGNRMRSKMLDEMPERRCGGGLMRDSEKQMVGVDQNVGFGEGFNSSAKVKANGVVADRLGCSRMDSVRKVFEMMPNGDLVSWNTLISGNVQNGMYEEALMMVRQMGNANLQPDKFTLSILLPMFAEYADVIKGKEVHGYAVRRGFDRDLVVGSSLMDILHCATKNFTIAENGSIGRERYNFMQKMLVPCGLPPVREDD